MTDDRIPITRQGYEKLKGDLSRLESEMLEVTKRVATARELGDLSENAEYHAAREDQGMKQAQINLVRDKLSRAQIIDPSSLPKDTIVFGSHVKVHDLDFDEDETYQLVGPGEENPDDGRILTTSPVAQGLLGRKKGDVVEIAVPARTIRFKILDISFE